MCLSVFEHGRLSLVPLSSSRTNNVFEVNALIAKLFEERRQLSLDFNGEYVPICAKEEISIVASLLAAYHNSLVRSNIQVTRIQDPLLLCNDRCHAADAARSGRQHRR